MRLITLLLRLRLPPAPDEVDNILLWLLNCQKNYDEHIVFNNANLVNRTGQKVAFVGKNGGGKSTMIKAIMGEIEFQWKTGNWSQRKNWIFCSKPSIFIR